MDSNLHAYNDYYDKPAWWFQWRYDTQVKRKTCLALIKTPKAGWAGKKICELGFGSANLLFSFPKNCSLYGIELSRSAIARAAGEAKRRGYSHVELFPAKAPFSIPLPDAHLDLVIASHVLEHVADDRECLGEIRRVLAPGGLLALLVPINERYQDEKHLRQYSLASCKNLCEARGFHFVREFENELLFHLVERMYWRYRDGGWSPGANLLRVLFNLSVAPLPFWAYRLLDGLMLRATSLRPRQAALLLEKRT